MHLIFTVRLEKQPKNLFIFFGIRPFFEEAFRTVAGCTSSRPGIQGHIACCQYHETFLQSLAGDSFAVRRHQKPSFPFIFQPVILPNSANTNLTVELGLILVGKAVHSIAVYLEVMQKMFAGELRQKAVASVVKVESIGYRGERSIIYEPGRYFHPGTFQLLSLQGLTDGVALLEDRVKVSIIAPVRIIVDGRHMREICFSSLLRSLFRRVSSMAFYFGGSESGYDFKWLAKQSHLVEWENAEFHWDEWEKGKGGMVGYGYVLGIMPEFQLFLLAGRYFNIGKGAAFGFGQIKLN